MRTGARRSGQGARWVTALALVVLLSGSAAWGAVHTEESNIIPLDTQDYLLIINSLFGQADPPVGVYTNAYATNLLCAVTNGVLPEGPTQHVCVGWTGTGSAPPSGTTTNTGAFAQTNETTVTWNWTNLYLLAVFPGPNGTVNSNAMNGWYTQDFTVANVTATPTDGYHFTQWTGTRTTNANPYDLLMDQAHSLTANFSINIYDISASAAVHGAISPSGTVQVAHGGATNFSIMPDPHYHIADVEIDGSSIGPTNAYVFANVTNDRAIWATFDIDRVPLQIASTHGSPNPPVGTYTNDYGLVLTNTVEAIDDQEGAQYVCTGWTMAGNEETSGTTNWMAMTHTNDASLTWLWATQYWLTVDATVGGTADPTNQWVGVGLTKQLVATPDPNWHFTGWTGDTNAITIGDPASTSITVVVSNALTLTANFDIYEYPLEIASAHGSPTPSVGTYTNDNGTLVTNAVAEVDPQGATQHLCTGWVMTGNEPLSGTTNWMTMTHTNDAVFTWQWLTQYWLDTGTNGPGSVDVADTWIDESTVVTVTATAASGYHFVNWQGDMETNANPLVLTMDRAYAVTAYFTNHAPVVTNVFIAQRAGTKLVDITYDVTDADGDPLTITVEVSTDGGQNYTLPAENFRGTGYGPGIEPGTNLSVVWDAGADWPDSRTTNLRVRVTADDTPVAPPDGMVLVPGGSFEMGAPAFGPREVSVSALFVDELEVTYALWTNVYTWATNNGYMFTAPAPVTPNDRPVGSVSWHDCVKWCNARSEMETKLAVYFTDTAYLNVYRTGVVAMANAWVKWGANGYRLPTESEWEKAARGGLTSKVYPWGDGALTGDKANYQGSGGPYEGSASPAGYYDGNQVPAGGDMANGFGLYDAAGNVREWCWDRWTGSPPAAGAENPRGPDAGTDRILRGGAFSDPPASNRLRCSDRSMHVTPDSAAPQTGLRCVILAGGSGGT